MRKLIVPQEDVAEICASRSAAVELALHRQRRRDSVQSILSSFLLVGLLLTVMALIVIIPWDFGGGRPIVTYQGSDPEPEEMDRPEVEQRARPHPPGQRASGARAIAASAPAPVAIPVPDFAMPEGPFGMSDEFGEGWGDAEGDGSGGGGASFFGSSRKGRRVVYVVDFSGSMESTAEGGGTRVAALRQELVRSIQNLAPGMQFAVIFFSSRSWSMSTEGPDYVANGWNGLGTPPPVNWYPATSRIKKDVIARINAMPADGGTMWYPGLKQAFSMVPPPNIVYLLSDGEPRDGEDLVFQLKEVNPRGVPIDTIAFELPGSPARLLQEISRKTGGQFSMVFRGKLLRGAAADKFTDERYD